MSNGYYWIKCKFVGREPEWLIGWFASSWGWSIVGSDEIVKEREILEIGDHIEIPDKYKE